MKLEQARVTQHHVVRNGYAVICLDAPETAREAVPGQFVHLRIPGLDDAVLRRPFSIYRADGGVVRILYKQIGRGTRMLGTVSPGKFVSIVGPLGNGFPRPGTETIPVFVAGGYGVAPLEFLARNTERKGLVFVGGKTAADVLLVGEFEALGWPVRVATEDGSLGEKGLVTDVLDAWLEQQRDDETPEFFACGPDGLLRAVGERAVAGGWRAWLSLDKHMGCGVGACLACVQRVRLPDGGEAWKRVCRDGPVFESREIVWGKP